MNSHTEVYLLVMFLIVMLSFCYKNKNTVQSVGNTLFEGMQNSKEMQHEAPAEVKREDKSNTIGDKFMDNSEVLFKRNSREEEDEEVKDDKLENFRGRRSGFLGKRLGFRGKKEGMEELEVEEEEEDDAFRGRRRGLFGNRTGFLSKKKGKGKNGFAGVRERERVVGEAAGFRGFEVGCAAGASQLGD